MRTPRGKSNQQKGASGSKSSQEQGTPHRFKSQGKTKDTADERKKAQKVTPNDPERHTEPKASGESHTQANLNPPQGQKETTGTRRKKRQKKGRGRREEEGQTPGAKGLEKKEDGAVRNKNPRTSLGQ